MSKVAKLLTPMARSSAVFVLIVVMREGSGGIVDGDWALVLLLGGVDEDK